SREQLYLIGGRELVKRGLACLGVDGPGNGEALQMRNLHLRPEYERPTAAAVDYLETQSTRSESGSWLSVLASMTAREPRLLKSA
ncbi:MAG: hypothetical protein NZ578_01530, partial [Candidatus Binatia bacterium]|nr:hypothetical protein [Candidatus Binatia bacterium]